MRVTTLCVLGIGGIGVIFLLLSLFPLSYTLFEMTNQDTNRPYSIHIHVTEDPMQNLVLEETIIIPPGQRVERRVPAWKRDKNFNFTVTVDGVASSQFTINMWRGHHAVIDIADPYAHALINPCIRYDDPFGPGLVDNGNPKPLFTLLNSAANTTHRIRVSVMDNESVIQFVQDYTLSPGQEVGSPMESTISSKRYLVTTTDERNQTAECDMRIGPHTANCRMIIRETGIEVVDFQGITVDYAARYWTGKCSGQGNNPDPFPAATLNIPPVE